MYWNCSNLITINPCSPVLDTTNWHHYAFIKGSGGDKVYIDTIEQTNTSGAHGVLPTDTSDLVLGIYHGGSDWDIDGKLQDFRMYNREISMQTLKTIYSHYHA